MLIWSPKSCPCALVSMLCSQQLEWRALSMVRSLSEQLRSACSNVVSSAQGLPGVVQDQITNARQSAEELYSSMGSTSSITPVMLERSRYHLAQVQTLLCCLLSTYPQFFFSFSGLCLVIEVRECACSQVQQSLDGVMEYLLNNTPLNWLVGPFAPQITEKAEEDMATAQSSPHK